MLTRATAAAAPGPASGVTASIVAVACSRVSSGVATGHTASRSGLGCAHLSLLFACCCSILLKLFGARLVRVPSSVTK